MARFLLRCRRCRQPILSDARCCPHCAVARPVAAGRWPPAILLGGLALVIALLALHRYDGAFPSSLIRPITLVTGAATVAGRNVTAADLPDRADMSSIACRKRGGVAVLLRQPDGGSVQRCAVTFDDADAR